MIENETHIGILRCTTHHVWPENTSFNLGIFKLALHKKSTKSHKDATLIILFQNRLRCKF